jgi:hypothetical protein
MSSDTRILHIDNLDMVKHAVIDLRNRLKTFFGINDNPIFYDRGAKAYKTRFDISDESFSSTYPS